MPLSPLESRLHYEFRNAELLRQAMTHRSHSATHNERLEFLGDSVLNCVVAALLFQRFSKLDEGDLSRVRANLVKQQSLYEIAQALNIAEALRLGEGELRSGGFRRPSILADTLEAVLGAIFLDGGFDAAQTVIKRLYVPILDHIDPRTLGKDAKTLLQEYLQGRKIALPSYTVIATTGAAHNQQFEVECTVPKLEVKVFGTGASRRAAEQAAAKKALEEVMAVAPQLLGKPKRSKSAARAAKRESEDAPSHSTGVQGALDLRPALDRKAERLGRAERTAVQPAERAMQPMERRENNDRERASSAPLPHGVPSAVAMMRASHADHSIERASRQADKGAAAATTADAPLARAAAAMATPTVVADVPAEPAQAPDERRDTVPHPAPRKADAGA
ncbi:ribonuclease III [Mycetohabitans sp. B46]|uniref:ribonuclease III n=1 Tax=Mycetohabitans sp. B46 TaxID=2772536 RepID=UPI00307E4106